MATATGGFSSYPSIVKARVECYIVQHDPGNNRTLVRADAYIDVSGSASSYNIGISISVNGNGASWSSGYQSYGSGNHLVIAGHDTWVGHGDTGTRGNIGFSISGSSGGWGSASASNELGGFPDYDRRPGNPSFASIYRSYDDMYVGLNGVSSPASGLTYYIERSQDGGGWGDQRASQSTWYSNLPFGTTHQFRSLTANADGSNPAGWQYSGVYSIPNVPSAPSSIAATTPSALSSTISIGTSSNNGAGITAYYVQASPDNGTTWLSPQLMTNQSYTYNGLTPGATYKFRSYAVNEMGSGAYATTGSTFVPAGGKRWTGTAWQPTATAKRWNGTAWVDLTTAKRWSGSAWVDLT